MKTLLQLTKFFTIAAAAILLFSLQAYAQSITPVADTTTGSTADQKAPFKIDLGYSHRIQTDIKGGGEDFNVQSVGVKASNHLQLNPCYTLNTAINYEYNDYQFHNNNRYQWKNRFDWNRVHLVSIDSMLGYQLDDKWSFYGGPILNVGAEEGSEFKDTLSGGAAAGFNYVYSPTLTAGGGLAVVSRIEDPVATVPIVRLDWKFADKWNLHAGSTDLGSSAGYGMAVSFAPIESLTLSSGLQEQDKRFRLANEWSSGHPKDGVATDKYSVAYAKACYDVTKQIGIEGYAGMAFSGKLKLEDKSGQALKEQEYDQTPMFGLRTIFSF